LVASTWSADAPRRRRIYDLTEAGRLALEAKTRQWRAFADGVQAVVQWAT